MKILARALPLALLLLPLPGFAQGYTPAVTQFTAAQRDEIVAIVRAALKSDPSILRDAVTSLQADEGLRHEAASRAAIAATREKLAHASEDPVAGNPAGDVTLIEFYDVRCPYCRRMLPVMDQLLREDHGVRLVLKDLPVLGPPSVLGAKAMLAAQRQGGYFKLQDVLMRATGPITEDTLATQAQMLGLDWPRMQRDMADPAIQQHIDADLALAHTLNIQGTPALVIGDHLIPGAVEIAELRQAIAETRAQ
ncbi:MAG: thioredoxin domain-containing protein [Acidisphaera sp.]|nr:thioredoxin domain-containing protein [Acidisphaera sp.]